MTRSRYPAGPVVETRWWTALDDGRVQCDVCPRHCKLGEGQRGVCFVRAAQKNKIVLTTYGRSSGFAVDPIEKKPLNHFLPGTAVLSFGTAGCNLTCRFCQNWHMSKARETDLLAEAATPEEIAEAAVRGGCWSVAFTYNDPVVFWEYAVDVARECRARGIKTAAVTAGYICEGPREEFFEWMDAANVDLKAFSDKYYKDLCGAKLDPVLKTLEQFDFTWPTKINRLQVQNLFRLKFIEDKVNAIFIGGVGLGKTHAAIALGLAACHAGYRARFATAIDIINNLAAAQKAGRLVKEVKAYIRPELLIIDELGYLPVDKHGADLLFQIISRRYERGSIVLTTNKTYKHWPSIFNNDSTLTSAILDRLLHHAETIIIEGKSYRMKDRIEP